MATKYFQYSCVFSQLTFCRKNEFREIVSLYMRLYIVHRQTDRQTDRQFSNRYKENKNAWRNNNGTSNFAKYLTEEIHSFGPMKEIMEIIQVQKKGPHLNTIERFHIRK